MIFDILGKSLHHQMILGPPDGSLDFSKHQRLLVERPSAKIHTEKYPPQKKTKIGKLDNLPKSSFFDKMASFFMPFFILTKTLNKLKIKKPYIKLVRDSCLWDSGRWEWWEIILGWIPVKFSRHLTLQNLRNINFLVIFSILDGGPRKVNDLLTSPNNQFRD